MTDILKTIGISVAVVIVALLLTGNFSTSAVGGTYELTKQYFSQGIDVDGASTFGSSAATTSINFGKACWTVTAQDGDTTYVSFNTAGSLATSSTSCN